MHREDKRNIKNILIISGGNRDVTWGTSFVSNHDFDFIIAADSGGEYAAVLDLQPDILLGDFDSISKKREEELKLSVADVFTFPAEKDDTDTSLALRRAIDLKPETITIIGASGSRLDHTLNNIFSMTAAADAGIECRMADKNNLIYLKNTEFSIMRDKQYGKYVSLIPVTDTLELTLKGMKYPLERYTVKRGSTLCQSNEITADRADIIIHSGTAAVFESLD